MSIYKGTLSFCVCLFFKMSLYYRKVTKLTIVVQLSWFFFLTDLFFSIYLSMLFFFSLLASLNGSTFFGSFFFQEILAMAWVQSFLIVGIGVFYSLFCFNDNYFMDFHCLLLNIAKTKNKQKFHLNRIKYIYIWRTNKISASCDKTIIWK